MKRAARHVAPIERYHRVVTCAGSRCTRQIPHGKVLCIEHWWMLPRGLRTAIVRTHRAGHLRSYQDYVRQAVDLIDAVPQPQRSAIVHAAENGVPVTYIGRRL